ncbi:MAG: excinuclease ABC subunit UvrA [Anaerolineae bacterium]
MTIQIEGAAEHNLQDVDITFGDGLTVVTGVSGSGKTSLVFDTLYHEARRRFLEVYALGSSALRLAPARVRHIAGLGPAVAVEQNTLNRNPLSTLATSSGLHPFLRLLYARFGERVCATCGAALAVWSEDERIERLAELARTGGALVTAPLVHGASGSHRTLLDLLASAVGREALSVDGALWDGASLDPAAPHTIEVTLAELAGDEPAGEIREVVRRAAALGCTAVTARGTFGVETLSSAPVCAACGSWFGDLEPVLFHTPCPRCQGKGCPACGGTGLHPQAAAVRWHGLRLPDLLRLSVDEVATLFSASGLPSTANRLLREVAGRLEALQGVGLGYLALDRSSPTLSRGESQRVRLAVSLTSRLEDVLHVLDEPTVGQHPADVARLLPALRRLAGPVVYVEHDRVAAAAADRAVDLGPGAGGAGGRVVYEGTPAGLWEADTPSGRYFSRRERVAQPQQRPAPERFLTLRGAAVHNLQGVDVAIPLERLTVITGVSGSGKSTLVEDVLVPSLAQGQATGCRTLEGPALKPVLVDQDPIGHNPRSNPATYTKLADIVRDGFAAAAGISASCFSFNRPEGACPACGGIGATEAPMRYLPSTWIPCAACEGKRFSEQVLAARVRLGGRDLSIADLYALPIAEATPLLLEEGFLRPGDRQAASGILQALCDVGLGYLSLGQPSPTLSGGEAQRVKLAKFLGRRTLAGQLLVLDEPSTGLHPQDIAGLLVVLDRLVRGGATIVVVEHQTDIIRAADWVIDLGPGAGPAGGRLLYAGPPQGLEEAGTPTGQALRDEDALEPNGTPASPEGRQAAAISIRDARANNLKGVSVDLPKGALTVVTGVSGSGKSSLVGDVLEAEARRRFLETLSLYERQSTREGPEAAVGSLSGLGVTLSVTPDRRMYDRRSTVGTASEISHHLAELLAWLGERRCLTCGATLRRESEWVCPVCGARAPLASARHFDPLVYAAMCTTCHGVGTLNVPAPEKLIIHPERPLCGGAMYSPGFFPKGYLCEPLNGGYDLVQALAARFGFDPFTLPWREMAPEAQNVFLYGDAVPMQVTFRGRSGRASTHEATFPGFYGWVRDWDVGGTYTTAQPCPDCAGERLRPAYRAVTLAGHNLYALSEMPLTELAEVLAALPVPGPNPAEAALPAARRRLRFLDQVGLGYLHLSRPSATLSAGEAQRIKLAGLLGGGLTSLTLLLDEPTRGLHPREVGALLEALRELRDQGNTLVVVEHDLEIIRAADYLVDMGPGAGAAGGQVVARGTSAEVAQAKTVTGRWLRAEGTLLRRRRRRPAHGWLTVRGARENNLRGDETRLPLGVLVGVCGVSGSGKSTLVVDTLGRALAPVKQTTSVAREPLAPGAHEAIEGAPPRTVVVDQARAGLGTPAACLGLDRPLRALYAAGEDAQALGLDADALGHGCSACKGRGSTTVDMGFLPDVHTPCDVCGGTGLAPEAAEVRLHGLSLADAYRLTLDELAMPFGMDPAIARAIAAARSVGLGYLVLHQPSHTLSGGEAQRLKIAAELCARAPAPTLYILDEPTVGQHLEDVARLAETLHHLVSAGHSVLVVEHHPHLLAACDWLVELGPGGGPQGGRVIAAGTPETLAAGNTPTAPYLRALLEAKP